MKSKLVSLIVCLLFIAAPATPAMARKTLTTQNSARQNAQTGKKHKHHHKHKHKRNKNHKARHANKVAKRAAKRSA